MKSIVEKPTRFPLEKSVECERFKKHNYPTRILTVVVPVDDVIRIDRRAREKGVARVDVIREGIGLVLKT